jgi:hypothetical protein
MDTITMEELKELLPKEQGWHISLYLPTYKTGRETQQNAIRFKNLLQEAEERLQSKGFRLPDVKEMLEPAEKLLDSPAFWQNQSHGLAVFLSKGDFHYYRLPLQFDELVIIGPGYHIKPLLPFFSSDGHFYILALSQNEVRLLEGTRDSVDTIDLERMPETMAEALQLDRLNKDLQFHTSASTPGPGSRSAAHHGHDPSDENKTRILKWFKRIDSEMPKVLIGNQSPMVLAGVEFLFPLYHEANSYPHLIEEGISGNPDELKPEELHSRAWPIIEPYFMQTQENAVAKYHQLTNSGQTTTDVQEVVQTAHQGRVAELFVALDVQVWGDFEQSTNIVHIHENAQTGDKDLLDLASIQTILNGGSVFAVEKDQVPGGGVLAAVFRY